MAQCEPSVQIKNKKKLIKKNGKYDKGKKKSNRRRAKFLRKWEVRESGRKKKVLEREALASL